MKLKCIYLSVIFLFLSSFVFAQSLELGANFASSNENFYKNIFGGNLAYIQHFNKQYLFVQYKYAFKNNSYSNIKNSTHFEGYEMQKVDGTLMMHSIKMGVAQKMINKPGACLSVGLQGGLNYVNFDEQIVFVFYNDERDDGGVSEYEEKLHLNNRFGFGGFVDMEFKDILLNRLSLFSKVEINHVDIGNDIRGISFVKSSFSSITFSMGLRFNLKKEIE